MSSSGFLSHEHRHPFLVRDDMRQPIAETIALGLPKLQTAWGGESKPTGVKKTDRDPMEVPQDETTRQLTQVMDYFHTILPC